MKPNINKALCDTCLHYGGDCPHAKGTCPLYIQREHTLRWVVCAVALVGVILMFIVLW